MSKEEINAFLGSGTVYQGKLTFQGAVRIDGVFSGEIQSEGCLIVGKDAQVDGMLEVGELVMSGMFSGNAKVNRRTSLHRTGIFEGDLHTVALYVEEGAILEGRLFMKPKAEIPAETDKDMPKK